MDADDEIIVNLIVISKTLINTKLYTSGIYLNLEQPSYVPESIRRWVRQDSRDETIKKVDRIVTRAVEYTLRNDSKTCLFKTHLMGAKTGLLNLRETYSNCIQTVARLDTIVNKIVSVEEPATHTTQHKMTFTNDNNTQANKSELETEELDERHDDIKSKSKSKSKGDSFHK